MSRRSMGRQASITAAECDTYSGRNRRYYCYLSQAGAIRYVKRTTHRRARREAKAEIRREAPC